MSLKVWVLLVSSVALSSLAQLLLKLGLKGAGPLDLSWRGLTALALRVLTNGYLLAGLAGFVGSAVLWLIVLSQVELSLAYPLVSLGYVFVLCLAHFVLGESISTWRLGGVAAIIAGVILIGRS